MRKEKQEAEGWLCCLRHRSWGFRIHLGPRPLTSAMCPYPHLQVRGSLAREDVGHHWGGGEMRPRQPQVPLSLRNWKSKPLSPIDGAKKMLLNLLDTVEGGCHLQMSSALRPKAALTTFSGASVPALRVPVPILWGTRDQFHGR